MLRQSLRNCSPWEELMLDQLVTDCIPMMEQGKGVRMKEWRHKEVDGGNLFLDCSLFSSL